MLPPTQTSLQPVRVVGGWSNAQVSPNRKKALCCSLCCIFVLQFRCRSDVAQCHLTQSCVTLTPAAASAATDAAAATSLSSSATEEGTCILAKGENLPLPPGVLGRNIVLRTLTGEEVGEEFQWRQPLGSITISAGQPFVKVDELPVALNCVRGFSITYDERSGEYTIHLSSSTDEDFESKTTLAIDGRTDCPIKCDNSDLRTRAGRIIGVVKMTENARETLLKMDVNPPPLMYPSSEDLESDLGLRLSSDEMNDQHLLFTVMLGFMKNTLRRTADWLLKACAKISPDSPDSSRDIARSILSAINTSGGDDTTMQSALFDVVGESFTELLHEIMQRSGAIGMLSDDELTQPQERSKAPSSGAQGRRPLSVDATMPDAMPMAKRHKRHTMRVAALKLRACNVSIEDDEEDDIDGCRTRTVSSASQTAFSNDDKKPSNAERLRDDFAKSSKGYVFSIVGQVVGGLQVKATKSSGIIETVTNSPEDQALAMAMIKRALGRAVYSPETPKCEKCDQPVQCHPTPARTGLGPTTRGQFPANYCISCATSQFGEAMVVYQPCAYQCGNARYDDGTNKTVVCLSCKSFDKYNRTLDAAQKKPCHRCGQQRYKIGDNGEVKCLVAYRSEDTEERRAKQTNFCSRPISEGQLCCDTCCFHGGGQNLCTKPAYRKCGDVYKYCREHRRDYEKSSGDHTENFGMQFQDTSAKPESSGDRDADIARENVKQAIKELGIGEKPPGKLLCNVIDLYCKDVLKKKQTDGRGRATYNFIRCENITGWLKGDNEKLKGDKKDKYDVAADFRRDAYDDDERKKAQMKRVVEEAKGLYETQIKKQCESKKKTRSKKKALAKGVQINPYDEKWQRNFSLLKTIIRPDGRLEYSALSMDDERRMKNFVKDQRKYFRQRENNEESPLTDERYKLLAGTNFSFVAVGTGSRTSSIPRRLSRRSRRTESLSEGNQVRLKNRNT